MALHTYLPQDRLRALARGETLPGRAYGSVLFADISGFTALTESLHETLGPRRGAEELTSRLVSIFTALITEVEKYGGSVIGFAGDAVTCWFDGRDEAPALRAVAAGLALQSAMQQFPQLALKVAVATGPVRRLVMGDSALQLFDVLAGETLVRMAAGEHLARQGEALADEATVHAIGDALAISEWRIDPDTQNHFAVLQSLSSPTLSTPIQVLPLQESKAGNLPSEILHDWIPSWVYARAGQETFFNEFRAVTFVFLRFSGIDYESDAAPAQLQAYLQWVQDAVQQAEGYLQAPVIGDKGSFLLIAFGAPVAHEDDTRRALRLALTMRTPPAECDFISSTQIGIATGTVWTGLYGGVTRQSYGFIGDDVNLAARLMQSASPGEILVSGRVQSKLAGFFSFGAERLLQLKGKAGKIPAFAALGESTRRGIRLQEPTYYLPMAGRQVELQTISDKLDLTLQGQSQSIGIVAEAGMGKSRLVAEVIGVARRKGFVGYGGTCQSDAVNTPYQAWKSIWQAFFDVDPSAPLQQQIRSLERKIEDRAPDRVQALPLLNIVLDLEIPDNDFTKTLEPQYRKSALRALLEDCLRMAAKDEPLLVVIEDLHWIDALSHDLLEELARDLSDSRVCFVLAYRPPSAVGVAQLAVRRIEVIPNFSKIELHELNTAEAEQAIRAKLAQLYPARGGELPGGLFETLIVRSQGNPFYLEELLNYVHDRSIDLSILHKIELPDSLHSLIISRIDQLSEQEKITLRVASIIGRLFRAKWLVGYYPDLGAFPIVKASLDALEALDITLLDSPAQSPQGEPELAYLFKHIVTHEVTYESLPFATRANLHEQLAKYLETEETLLATSLLDTIAFHYGRSDNTAKKRKYYLKAADAAHAVSAYNTAIEYLTRLKDLTDLQNLSGLCLKLADAHKGLGDFTAARTAIVQAQAAATTDADRAAALALLGDMTSQLGDYTEAQTILAEAVPLARTSGDQLTLCRALYALGDVNWRQGKLDEAVAACEESLTLARALGDVERELFALNRLGAVASNQGNLDEAERLCLEVYTRAVAVGNRERASTALNNLGTIDEDYATARDYYQRALALIREIGDKPGLALGLLNLAELDIALGQLAAAREKLREGLALALRLGLFTRVVLAVMYFGFLAHAEGQTERALAYIGLVRRQPAWGSDNQRILDVALAEWSLDPSVAEAGLKQGEALDWDKTVRELVKE